MEVDGEVLVTPSQKCARLFKPLAGKKVDLTATGTRDHGALLKLLTCESKARKLCSAELAAYTPCHSSVMSVGQFNGAKHCGEFLEALHRCIQKAETGSTVAA
eukprot:m.18640 g.18640  ORF g.18640 m.18640 type:complete len:103 (-) comp5343_c0_seq1:263-571(-)